ncbi:lipid A biosynthesis lauroyl acyltransferase [Pseudogulbenkiania subflava]|uniref:KDO2-lipid IV(A) lauroyltransferase n=1 Tax=Pseudogulbenkiania subflava DSM 22618 TaxID=1123014 RepID=A0A1Y6BC62_9NEIS|nr:lipid A biosynthesis lauroyl acyltransferase [Pseudogulbenkiania subflava]SME96558.1 KDO2-lipid IV(A) lauroyltransferase [Pseudogulbenkiania subflava DSM 22618]
MKIVFALLWLLRLLPMWLIGALAWLLGSLAYALARERRRVGLINLRLCFPDMSLAERKLLIRRNFQHMIRLALEYGVCWWSSAERIRKLVTVKNLHYVTDLRAKGEDVILFYPHFVAFEMGAYRMNQDIPLVSVYSHQKNRELDAQIYKGRQRYDNCYIVSRQESLRSIIKAMRQDHAPFLYLPDQDFGPRDSLFVKFFDTDAATIPGLSRIAKLAKAHVVPVIARRVGNRFELEYYPPWENYPTDDVEADTRRMNAFLEERIREIPDQYFWLHKRFKTRPAGQPRFY